MRVRGVQKRHERWDYEVKKGADAVGQALAAEEEGVNFLVVAFDGVGEHLDEGVGAQVFSDVERPYRRNAHAGEGEAADCLVVVGKEWSADAALDEPPAPAQRTDLGRAAEVEAETVVAGEVLGGARLASSINVGAINLGNTIRAALGGAVIGSGIGYEAVPVAGGFDRRGGAGSRLARPAPPCNA